MRNIIGAVLLCLLPLASAAYGWQGQVVKVSDGDTLHVQQGREIVKVRLYGVDCPEKRQNSGRQAMQFTEQVLGKTVEVETVDRDRYGRTVGLVSSDGKLLNRELVREGHAWFYAAYCTRQPLCTELRELERLAKSKRAGLWRERNPLPPWEWRQRNPR